MQSPVFPSFLGTSTVAHLAYLCNHSIALMVNIASVSNFQTSTRNVELGMRILTCMGVLVIDIVLCCPKLRCNLLVPD